MDQQTYDKGLALRRKVLGDAYVDKSFDGATDFDRPLQDLLTEYCWGSGWARPGLDLKTRSFINLAMLSVLNRPHELRTHLRGALNNGITKEEIREVLLQVTIYGGAPAGLDSFRVAKAFFAEFETTKENA